MKVKIIDYSTDLDQNYAGFYGNTYEVDRYIGGNYIIRGVPVPKSLIKEEIDVNKFKEGDRVVITGECINTVSENDKDKAYFERYKDMAGIVTRVQPSDLMKSNLYTVDILNKDGIIIDVNWFLEYNIERYEP